MRRTIRIIALVFFVVILVVAIPLTTALFGRRTPGDTVEIGGISVIKDGIVTIGVVPVGQREVALIDAGNDKSGKAILSELQRRNLGPEAVMAILLTHGHPDHTASLGLFPKAQVMALDREAALIEGREGSGGPLTRLMPVRPTGLTVNWPLHDGSTVTVGQVDFHVFAVPGHTAGSAAYLVKGLLFLGDSADVGRNGQVQGAPWVFTDNQAENRASLVHLNDRLEHDGAEVNALVFAHSGVLTDGLAPLSTFAHKTQ